MSNTKTCLFVLFLLSIVLILACQGERSIPKNKISRSNPTYLNINYDQTPEFIIWQNESYKNTSYTRKEDGKFDYPLQVKLRQLKPKKILQFQTAPLFLLDTSAYNASGYLGYKENPKYFGELTRASAHSHLTEKIIIGTYQQELLDLGLSYKHISFVLMQFGVIGTYDHLYAEMVISDKKDTPDFYEIHYNCVYHICTSKCFDPEYKFSIRFDKKTREISIMPK